MYRFLKPWNNEFAYNKNYLYKNTYTNLWQISVNLAAGFSAIKYQKNQRKSKILAKSSVQAKLAKNPAQQKSWLFPKTLKSSNNFWILQLSLVFPLVSSLAFQKPLVFSDIFWLLQLPLDFSHFQKQRISKAANSKEAKKARKYKKRTFPKHFKFFKQFKFWNFQTLLHFLPTCCTIISDAKHCVGHSSLNFLKEWMFWRGAYKKEFLPSRVWTQFQILIFLVIFS